MWPTYINFTCDYSYRLHVLLTCQFTGTTPENVDVASGAQRAGAFIRARKIPRKERQKDVNGIGVVNVDTPIASSHVHFEEGPERRL